MAIKKPSPRTTVLGLSTILAGFVQAYFARDFMAAGTALTTGLGLIFAQDN